MAKYSFEFKKKVVLEYLNGQSGYCSLAKKYNIASHRRIGEWVEILKILEMKD